MTNKLELYKCNVCNNLVEVLNDGFGELVCCNKPMELIECNTSEIEELNEKHIPVIEKEIDHMRIRVGAVMHPMTMEHHISFIQAISNDKKYVKTKFLDINETPELNVKTSSKTLWSRALCNIHGLFRGEI
ncbi:desulfoferrodoxin FeS4 iron-binding domain-containing protein [bacterium]|nr:desulfoferrodoxin FeS4 iron-binding domain-containing protein [bacterium]